jgi:hypothetical protein
MGRTSGEGEYPCSYGAILQVNKIGAVDLLQVSSRSSIVGFACNAPRQC